MNIRKMSIKGSVLLYRFTLALIIYTIVILALWFGYYKINQNTIDQRYMENMLLAADNLTEQIHTDFEHMKTVVDAIAGSDYVLDFLKERDVLSYYEKVETISEIIQRTAFSISSTDNIITVNIYGEYYRFSGQLSNSACEKLFDTFQNTGAVYTIIELDGILYLCHNASVYDMSGIVPSRVGNVIMLTGLDKTRRSLDSGNPTLSIDVAIIQDDVVVVSNNPSIENKGADELDALYGTVTSIKLPGTLLTIIAAIPKDAHNPENSVFLTMALALLGLLISMVFVLYRYLSNHMIQPMANIMSHVRGISGGMGIRLPETGKGDFDALAVGINDMLDRNERYSAELMSEKQKLFDAELSRQNMRMDLLISQMDAHFVVNTLTGIKNLSDIGKNEKAGQMAEGLAVILRYRHTGEALVNIHAELSVLIKYISIMNIRYDDQFIVSTDIDESLIEYLMPGFVLQPVVENAFVHGLSRKPKDARLAITGRIKDDIIIFEISDNGEGIAASKLKEIQDTLNMPVTGDFPKPGLHGVALENIQRRIRLQLGFKYGLGVESESNRGTIVRIILPLIPDMS